MTSCCSLKRSIKGLAPRIKSLSFFSFFFFFFFFFFLSFFGCISFDV